MSPNDMRTISIQTNSVGTLRAPRAFLGTLQPHRPVAQWLPAPPVAKARPAKAVASSNSIWMPLDAESFAEKSLMTGLVLAGGIGIAYGFMCLLNLVENWAAVNASIRHLIQ